MDINFANTASIWFDVLGFGVFMKYTFKKWRFKSVNYYLNEN